MALFGSISRRSRWSAARSTSRYVRGTQQFAIIALGTVWASGAMALTRDRTMAAMLLTLPFMMLLGNYRRFGNQGIYGATTALFVITAGVSSTSTVGHRLLETLIGAAIGLLVNAFVLPPVHLRSVRERRARHRAMRKRAGTREAACAAPAPSHRRTPRTCGGAVSAPVSSRSPARSVESATTQKSRSRRRTSSTSCPTCWAGPCVSAHWRQNCSPLPRRTPCVMTGRRPPGKPGPASTRSPTPSTGWKGAGGGRRRGAASRDTTTGHRARFHLSEHHRVRRISRPRTRKGG
ncbi:hypothetical protein SMICM304S_05212 [Streptomyces microflavus]